MNRMAGWSMLVALAACAAGGGASAQTAAPAGFPAGASSVQETFDDWRVNCVAQADNRKECGALQEQVDSKSRQRTLLVQFEAPTRDKLGGMLVLPFGLALDRGVVPQFDDGAADPPLRFRTCLPGGCLVPLSFDAKGMASLRKAAAFKIKATTDGGSDVTFVVSLKGLPGALDRLGVLAK